MSGWSKVESGVPQGTVLGPLLFLTFINDLPDAVQSQVRLFADDCLLYRVIRRPEDQLILQRDLDSLEEWTKTWGMKFNPSKCTILTVSNSQSPLTNIYHLSGTALSHVDYAKYLGVTLSKDLKWSKHIQSATSRCCSTLGLLRRNLYMCPMELREHAYFTLVRSRLEYAVAVMFLMFALMLIFAFESTEISWRCPSGSSYISSHPFPFLQGLMSLGGVTNLM